MTDRWIQACAPPARGRLDYADGLCPGLHLRVTERGIKTFSVMLRCNGRLQRRTIGRYPAVSLAHARSRTLEMMRGAAAGIDPREPRAATRRPLTYAELVESYYGKHLKPNARSARNVRSSLLHPKLRHLRTRAIPGIGKSEIIDCIDAIVAAGTPQAAVNVLRALKMMFNWAVDRDLLAANPCERVRPPAKSVERDRVLANAELAWIWEASVLLPAPYGQMYRMFLLTGQRRSEVATMRWCDIDGETWTIPRERVKKDRSHSVPLTAAARAAIGELPRYSADGYVFSTTGGKSPSSNFAKVKKEMDRLSGVTGWRIHDIRRTVRSKLAELGVPRDVARKVLNHEDGKVDRIYNRHEYLAEKREALELWEAELTRLVSVAQGAGHGNGNRSAAQSTTPPPNSAVFMGFRTTPGSQA